MEEKIIKLYQDEIEAIQNCLSYAKHYYNAIGLVTEQSIKTIEAKLKGQCYPRYFREHRGGLNESVQTSKEVFDLKDVADAYRANTNFGVEYWKNFRIDKECVDDSERLTSVWKNTHYVLADMTYPGQEGTVVVGMCNFYEEGVVE